MPLKIERAEDPGVEAIGGTELEVADIGIVGDILTVHDQMPVGTLLELRHDIECRGGLLKIHWTAPLAAGLLSLLMTVSDTLIPGIDDSGQGNRILGFR